MTDPTEQETYRHAIDERFDRQDDMLGRIYDQAKLTNGRVNKLEESQISEAKEYAVFKARITTAIAIMTFFTGSIAVPIIASLLQTGKL